MLVKLYGLPPLEADITALAERGITIRRGIPPEKHFVAPWVGKVFSGFWQSECELAFSRTPTTCWIAVHNKRTVGFACYDTTAKGFFGPTGVSEEMQGRGIGRALLLACLHAMRWDGYGYAIIGGVGPVEFYEKTVGAVVIGDSSPGVWDGLLRQ